jgi:hypothetical protein
MKHLFLSILSALTLCSGIIRGQSLSTPSARSIAATSDTAQQPYAISGTATGTLPLLRCADDVIVYPNPAQGSDLNVVYDPAADIKRIAIYNLIGNVVAVYKVTGNNSANLNLDTLTPGIYFVRLYNTLGDVVVAKKFTRQ